MCMAQISLRTTGMRAAKLKQAVGGHIPSREEAAKETIAYSILKDHNTSGTMDKLKIKFDKLTSHDITFVGIIQTARASGLEKFPVPYVLTNCHNSPVCGSVVRSRGEAICSGLTCAKSTAVSMYRHIRQSFISSRGRCSQAAER